MRWGMVIDVARCVGCHACTIACKSENESPADAFYAPVIEYEAGTYPDAQMNYLPILCNHCEDAPCLTACPSGALTRRDDGIVLADEDVCIGSRACMTACPYGALHLFAGEEGEMRTEHARTEPTVSDRRARERHQVGTVSKCTYCSHKIDFGLEHGLTPGIDPLATPACVVTCPAECRIFGDLDDATSPISRYIDRRGPAEVLRPDAETGAHTFYVG